MTDLLRQARAGVGAQSAAAVNHRSDARGPRATPPTELRHTGPMRQAYAHDAVLAMGPDEDDRAPGGAITTALCGHWEHEPPCPLAAHHTGVTRDGDTVRLHILFAARPADEALVRRRIGEALASGGFTGPDGLARWRLVETSAGSIAPEESDHARRLAS